MRALAVFFFFLIGVMSLRFSFFSNPSSPVFCHKDRCFFFETSQADSSFLFMMLGKEDLCIAQEWIDYWVNHDVFSKIFLIDYDAKTESDLKKIQKKHQGKVVFLKNFDYAPLGFLPPYQHPALYVISEKDRDPLGPVFLYHEIS